MDLDAILLLHPELVVVDELAHTNVEGSRHEKRWQDVMELLEAGINVITAVNIQHIESLNEEVRPASMSSRLSTSSTSKVSMRRSRGLPASR